MLLNESTISPFSPSILTIWTCVPIFLNVRNVLIECCPFCWGIWRWAFSLLFFYERLLLMTLPNGEGEAHELIYCWAINENYLSKLLFLLILWMICNVFSTASYESREWSRWVMDTDLLESFFSTKKKRRKRAVVFLSLEKMSVLRQWWCFRNREFFLSPISRFNFIQCNFIFANLSLIANAWSEMLST